MAQTLAPAASETERPNTVKLEDAGPSCKKLSIEIPAEVVSGKIKDSLEALSVEAELPGFRKGRVPRWLVEKRFGQALRKEAKTELVASAFNKAVEDLKLKVVGQPGGGNLEKAEIVEGKPFAFEIEVEVLPEFEMAKLDGIEVKKPIIEITEDVVNDEVRKISINEGTLESRETSEPGDYITGHAIMKGVGKDATEFYNLKGAVVQVPADDNKGKGMILGIMVDDFAKQLGTMKAGDTATIKATGPENHEVEGIRNAELVITFTADRIDRIIPSPLEPLLGSFGVTDEAQLKELIRTRMGQRVMVQQQAAMHQQLAKYLVDNTKIDLPERMTTQQATRTLEKRRLDLMYRGVEAHKIEEHMAELRAASSATAARDLALFFILHKAAEDLKIGVTDAEINTRIAQIAFQRNVRPEQLRHELQRTNQIGGIYQQIRDHKTLDAILAKANVTEMPAEEFNKLMRDDAKDGKGEAKAEKKPAKKAEPKDEDDKEEKAAKKTKKK
jgi:trigger factor